ncbi:PspC domain-containing protein [Serinibacter salmoneus]|uniref:Phage shock protein C (PspC) family protein n=1 Tax=Serinibacter salmoneus TaxID=556530 RepID=A0A2A9CY98_9MICO|nr:PspC domain-containing protein [Serinibacter salmoneus]PFG19404.1 phage shock protein C (PspC) family protein [Serinibacter salmoneus]
MDNVFNALRSLGLTRGPDRLLGGVCAGIAVKTGVDVWLVRALVLLLMLLPVLSWVVYAIVWILLPWQDGSIPLQRWLGGPSGGSSQGGSTQDAPPSV